MPSAPTSSKSLYREQAASFDKHLEAARHAGSERVHKLRIDIKNIRALIGLTDAIAGNKKKHRKLPALLKPLFKTGGAMRTAALNLQQIRDHKGKGFDAYRDHLRKQKEKNAKSFREKVETFDKKKLHRHMKQASSHETQHFARSVKDHIRSIVKEIRELLPGYKDDKLFHEVRKLLKKIRIIRKLLRGSAGKDGRFSWVSDMEESIGKWHDGVTLLESLEHFIARNKDLEDLRSLIRFVSDLDKRNRRTKAQIASKLRRRLASLR